MSYLISNKTRIWIREEEGKAFYYASLDKVHKMLSDKKKIFTVSFSHKETQILSCDFAEQTDLFEFQSFSGSRITVGENVQFMIDNVWVPLNDINYHEHIVEYSILKSYFKNTYAMRIDREKNVKAWKVTTSDHTLVANNFLIKVDI